MDGCLNYRRGKGGVVIRLPNVDNVEFNINPSLLSQGLLPQFLRIATHYSQSPCACRCHRLEGIDDFTPNEFSNDFVRRSRVSC